EIDELVIIYNHFVSAISQEVLMNTLIPISNIEEVEATSSYEYEPGKEEILKVLLPQYAESISYGALLDDKGYENAIRMTEMNSSTYKAGKLLDYLTLSYNRIRRTTITQEITKIVGGAADLE